MKGLELEDKALQQGHPWCAPALQHQPCLLAGRDSAFPSMSLPEPKAQHFTYANLRCMLLYVKEPQALLKAVTVRCSHRGHQGRKWEVPAVPWGAAGTHSICITLDHPALGIPCREPGAPCLLSNLLSLRKSHIINPKGPRDSRTVPSLGPATHQDPCGLGDLPGGKNLGVWVSTVPQVLPLLWQDHGERTAGLLPDGASGLRRSEWKPTMACTQVQPHLLASPRSVPKAQPSLGSPLLHLSASTAAPCNRKTLRTPRSASPAWQLLGRNDRAVATAAHTYVPNHSLHITTSQPLAHVHCILCTRASATCYTPWIP